MVLVNNPGSWSHIYPPLAHAEWFGWTPTDLIFPFFVFIVGTALAFSLRKYCDGSKTLSSVRWLVARRAAMLMLLGVSLNIFGKLCEFIWGSETSIDWATLRIPGVLQRIGLVYFVTSFIVLHVRSVGQIMIAISLLLGHWGLLHWLPNSNDPETNLSATGNISRAIDLAIFDSGHLYTGLTTEKTEPEGILGTLPTIVTALMGYWAGLFIQWRGISWRTALGLIVCGLVSVSIGLACDPILPICKKLWTSSFVLLSGGLGMVGLAVCLILFDILSWKRLARPFEIVGVNAIFVYMASEMAVHLLIAIPIKLASGEKTSALDAIYVTFFRDPMLTHLTSDERLASLAMALVTVTFWWLVLWFMARRGWVMRV
jgi:predicted acyltransferase